MCIGEYSATRHAGIGVTETAHRSDPAMKAGRSIRLISSFSMPFSLRLMMYEAGRIFHITVMPCMDTAHCRNYLTSTEAHGYRR